MTLRAPRDLCVRLLLTGLCAFVQSTAAAQVIPQFEPQTVASGLESIWSLAFTPDGRLFLTERPGRIRVISGDKLQVQPWAVIPVHESARSRLESGLMGLAIDPQFARNRRVYVCYTHAAGEQPGENRIAVLTDSAGRGTKLTVLLTGLPAGPYHNGCRLKFGPDGKLYATTGDGAGDRPGGGAGQDLKSLGGKILRLNPDGSIPADNPFPNSYIWSYGHRNSQGIAFDASGRLYATEHGTGGNGNNELNLIEKGKNYGWPIAIGAELDARFSSPIHVGPDAPAGATFVRSDKYGDLRGSLLVGTLSSERLLRFRVTGGAVHADVLIEKTYGRIRDVSEGPDGFIYIATSNRDGRRAPLADDDRVIRLLPADSSVSGQAAYRSVRPRVPTTR
jgi:aldose sugar dehydrogenase